MVECQYDHGQSVLNIHSSKGHLRIKPQAEAHKPLLIMMRLRKG